MRFVADNQMASSDTTTSRCMTHHALDLLAQGLRDFEHGGAFINGPIFDEISKEARFLSNKMLADRCKTTKRQCHDARDLLYSQLNKLERRQMESDSETSSVTTLTDSESSGCTLCNKHTGCTSAAVTCDSCMLRCSPVGSRSAPATPALALRCSHTVGGELKRRSQSFDDEIASRVIQEAIAKNMEKCDSEQTILNTPQECDGACRFDCDHECSSEMTESFTSTLEDQDPGSSQDEMGVAFTPTPSRRCVSKELDEEAVSDYMYSSVDPGHRYLYQQDITIPLADEMLHCNNNVVIKSPVLECGEIITYSPTNSPSQTQASSTGDNYSDRPTPTARKSTYSTQSSIDSDDLLAESVAESEDCPLTHAETFSGSTTCDLDAPPTDSGRCAFRDSTSPAEQSSQLSAPWLQSQPEDKHSSPHSQCQLSPVVSPRQKLTAMQKRRSFHGFANSLNLPHINFSRNKKAAEISIKRLSVGSDVTERHEGDDVTTESHLPTTESSSSLSTAEQIEHLDSIEKLLKERESSRLMKSRRLDRTTSLVTASSDSLPSLPEEETTAGHSSPITLKTRRPSSAHFYPVPVNSHLMNKRVLPTTRSSSMADLRLTESEIKSRVTLAHVMDELIQTERDYVIALRLVVDHYIPELSREDVPQTLRGKRGLIFGNIEKIYNFHNHYFLSELSLCENEPFKISQCFLKHQAEFLMYAMYNKNKPKSDQLMAEYGSAFFKAQQLLMGDRMDLSSYLLKPVQRMGKYALILKQILKECPESDPHYPELQSAEDMIRFCLQHGNDLLAMDALQECDVNLQEQGTLLLQGEFVVTRGRRKCIRHIFLFEQLILFAKPRKIGAGRDTYMYKHSLKTSDIGLTENVGSSGLKFEIWFRKRSGESWTVQAPSTQLKNKWVNVIEKILWTQAVKNREVKQSEQSNMGVGNKPCLDLKVSADNIKDRFIPSFNHSSKEEKITKRHAETIKKRPHSVISIAGSSSSNSSSGSTSAASTSRRSLPFIDMKAFGRLREFSRASLRLKKMYRSDSRINRCDSGISSISDSAFSSTVSPLKTTVTMPDMKQAAAAAAKSAESEV